MKRFLSKNNTTEMLQFPGLGGDCNISHFVTTRHGGVSKGAYASMNPGCYSGDEPDAVRQNRERICEALNMPIESLFAPYQVHGSVIRMLDEAFINESAEQQAVALHGVDALITDIPGVCVAVSTADCVPVLLYAPDQRVVAAIHAGWRGTVRQIVAQTVACMVECYACNPACMLAGIGPSISQEAFEVGEEVADAFRQLARNMNVDEQQLISLNLFTGKAHIDLWETNRLQLLANGLKPENIEVSAICTYTQCADFFSARRLGVQSGRVMSGIRINEEKGL
ncbi:MAG: peptidoglycan editing factor PgeF [Tannerellaceae bacterium]